jgi:hypothetical protein
MRKSFLLCALTLTTFFGVTAKHVTPEEALLRLRNSEATPAKKAAGVNADMVCTHTFHTSDNQEALYIFTGDGRSVVAPADDRIAPLLGYFDSHINGVMPESFRYWLNEYVSQIEHLIANPEIQKQETDGASKAATTETKTAISPLLKTQWAQTEPFNNACPYDNTYNATSVTGCVAAAGAQVMNYHRYPTEPMTADITYYDSRSKVNRTLATAGRSFDWSNMLPSYSGIYTDDEADAVAFLMAACGYAANMKYSSESSGTQSLYFLTGAKKYFGYNSSAKMLSREDIELAQWEDLLYENLQTIGPVFYSGNNGISGHAFVCDGYNNGYFHFNWGWNGSYDGYFLTSALKPQGSGTGGNDSHYSYNQSAMFNLTSPDAKLITLPNLCPIHLNGSLRGRLDTNGNLIITTTTAGSSSTIACYYNSSDQSYTGLRRVKVVNTATNVETYSTNTTKVNDLVPLYGTPYRTYSTAQLFSKCDAGEYRISFQFQESGSNTWLDATQALAATDYFTVTIDSDRKITSITSPTINTAEAESVTSPSVFYKDKAYRFSFKVTNTSNSYLSDFILPALCSILDLSEPAKEMVPYRDRQVAGTDDPVSIVTTGEGIAVNLAPGESLEYSGVTTFDSFDELDFDDIYFCLISKNTGDIIQIADSPLEIEEAPATTLTASSFTLDAENLQHVDTEDMTFNCKVECTEGYFAGKLYVVITDAEQTAALGVLNTANLIVLNEGETDTATITGSFDKAESGTKYAALLRYVDGSSAYTIATLNFATGGTVSGVEAISATDSQTVVTADRTAGIISIIAPSEITSIEIYGLDGRRYAPAVSLNGSTATVEMAQLPAGVNIIKASLSNGSLTVSKIIK